MGVQVFRSQNTNKWLIYNLNLGSYDSKQDLDCTKLNRDYLEEWRDRYKQVIIWSQLMEDFENRLICLHLNLRTIKSLYTSHTCNTFRRFYG